MLYFNADWSEIHFLSKLSLLSTSLFSLRLKACRFYLAGLHVRRSARQQSLMKILPLREREVLKQLKKDPSATVVASVRSTGATVVGSVNATEFWQRRTRSPSFLLLLSRKMDLAIPQWSTLRPGSRMIYYNYRFCDNYFCTCFLHWWAVFDREKKHTHKKQKQKKKRTKLRLDYGCSNKIKVGEES